MFSKRRKNDQAFIFPQTYCSAAWRKSDPNPTPANSLRDAEKVPNAFQLFNFLPVKKLFPESFCPPIFLLLLRFDRGMFVLHHCAETTTVAHHTAPMNVLVVSISRTSKKRGKPKRAKCARVASEI